uniref:EXPERA domain-containing protein n=1 Tax=Falco tinnunculus TaxID=100819 RepID=A0A8C4VDB1_FALTI
MRRLGTWVSDGLGSAGATAGLDGLKGLFQPKRFCDSVFFALLQLIFSVLTCCFVPFFKLTELLQWYATTFRDPMMLQPPEWFKAFMYCEIFLQMPFFPVAVYAFLKGWYKTSVRICPAQLFV